MKKIAHHQLTLKPAGSSIVSLYWLQIQLSLNYIAVFTFVLYLAILSGETYCDNPSWTMGIRKKISPRYPYSLISPICFSQYSDLFEPLSVA